MVLPNDVVQQATLIAVMLVVGVEQGRKVSTGVEHKPSQAP
jgi:hypothetical protein